MIYLYAVVSDRKGNIMLQKLYVFFRKETVLSIAVILALLSMFWVRPDKAYFTYIDFRTLGLLFCLMAIVAGLKAVGVFDILAMINPVITGKSGAFQTEEGCLSLDGVRPCTRYKEIEVDYLDQNFKKKHGKYTGWTAQIIQHEVDHCNGVVI